MKNISKNISIRSKVSVWYTFAMVAITIFSIYTILTLCNSMIQARQRSDLTNYIRDLAANADIDSGIVAFNSTYELNYNQISVIVYDSEHNVVSGARPAGFPSKREVPQNSVVTVREDKERWFVYETSFELYRETYYVRGITEVPMLINDEYVYTSLSTTLVILPLLILAAILGGSAISESAFAPFAELSDTVNNIQSGKDLSQRIEVRSNDEFGMLSTSFNSLFDRLQKSFEREKQFTDDASHELRTPITVILSECEYVKDSDSVEEMRESINVIHNQAKKMSSLINQLLTLSRTDDLSKVLNMDTFNYSELMEIVIEELEIQADKRDIKLINYIDKNLYVYGDQPTLTRMVINLISNAIKYGREGGWVKISITRKGDDIIGMISDNGIGISKDNISKIFDRFYQVNPARTNESGSMGLGLSMVKWIVEVHKGEISVESEEGEGTVFRFSLPICVEKPEDADDEV